MATEEKPKIKATIIFEMLGRPKEHLVDVMAKLIETINKERGVKVKGSKDHEPKKLENKDKDGKVIETPEDQTLYTTFSEVDLEIDDIYDLLRVSFLYMPANIEIISPSRFNLSNMDFASIVNGLLEKLHHYDSIAKSAIMENQILAKRLAQIPQPRITIEPVEQEDANINNKKKSKK